MRPSALLATSVLALSACTLDVSVALDPPPDVWDVAQNTHPRGAAFAALLSDYVRRGLPGVVLYVHTPEGVWNGAAGVAHIESHAPMQPTHRHHAASITKMYLATAALLLAEDGVLDLDAKMSAYLPASICDGVPNGHRVTVRELLGHTSGVPDFSGSLAYELDTLNDPLGSYPPDRMLSYLEGQSPIFSSGAGYFYSNADYLLLALVIDHAAGKSHADVVGERLLAPLGLGSTSYKNQPGYPTPAGLVSSYEDLGGDGTIFNVTDLAIHSDTMAYGQSGLIATSADYAAFIEALLGGEILGPAMLDAMRTPTECDCYGLGLSLRDTPYGTAIGHGGGDIGVRSEVRRFVGLDATLVLLVNAGESGVPGRLFDRVWDEVMREALAPLAVTTP